MNFGGLDWKRWTGRKRRTLLLLLLILAAGPAWLVLWRFVANRSVDLVVRAEGCGPAWSLRWTDKNGVENGQWLDLALGSGGDMLEVQTSGKTVKPDATYRFWFYGATPLGVDDERLKEINLKQVRTTPGATHGRWVDFVGGPGIVYVSNSPGSIRIRIPTSAVRLEFAKTPEGGPVTFKFADDQQVVDCASTGPGEGAKVTLMRRGPAQDKPIAFRLRLPTYDISTMRLAWESSPGGMFSIDRAIVRWRVFGIEVRRQPISIDRANEALQGSTLQIPKEAGSVSLAPPPGLGLVGHAVGFIVTWMGFGVLFLLAYRYYRVSNAGSSPWMQRLVRPVAGALGRLAGIVRSTSIAKSRWASPFLIACLVGGVVRIWMCAWAPLLFPPDAMDYLRETIVLLKTGRLDNSGIRVLGICAYFAPFWAWTHDFNFWVGVGNAVLGLLTAVMAGLIARRIMPRPLDAVVVLVVGLSPVLLAWERFGMSETPAAFLVTLMLWLALRPGRWSVSEGRLWIAVPLGVLMGGMIVVSTYVRLNLQVLAFFVPAAVLASVWPKHGLPRAVLLAVVVGASAFVGLLPRMMYVKHDFGVFRVGVGTEYAAGLEGWYSGLVDVNQTAVTDFETTRHLRVGLGAGGGSPYEYERLAVESKTIPVPRTGVGITDVDSHCGFVLRETASRRGDRKLIMALVQWAHLMGFWTRQGFSENDFWTLPLRGTEGASAGPQNYYVTPADYHGGFSQEAYDRTHREIGEVIHGPNAAVFGKYYQLAMRFRPMWAGLFMLGALGALARRDWKTVVLASLVGLHTMALAYVVLSWINRYCVATDPLMLLVAVYGLWRTCKWLVGWEPAAMDKGQSQPRPGGTDQRATSGI